MDFRIDTPLALLLLIPFVLYSVFVYRKQKWQRASLTAFVLRIVAVVCLILAMTNPYIVQPVKEEQLLFVVDRSASSEMHEQAAATFIADSLPSKNTDQLVGVYSFADQLQTEAKLSKEVISPAFSKMLQTDETNIEDALTLAVSVANPQLATRIVLMTDGNETKGEALAQAAKLANSNVSIDVVPFQQLALEDVMLTSFSTPTISYEGEALTWVAEVEAPKETTAKLVISENNVPVLSREVTLSEGHNQLSSKLLPQSTGLLKYDAKLQVDDDAFYQNNQMTSVTTIRATPKVLIVEGERASSTLPSIVGTLSMQIEVMKPDDLPVSLSSYLAYDAIIFDNVSAHLIGETKMAVMEQAVKHFGVGFLMIGGMESFALGGYYKTKVEELLPVVTEVQGTHELPTLGLMLVIDRSGSMDGVKMELAKEAAARSIELLREEDTLGVIAFDDKPWEIVPTARLKDKEEARDRVLSIPSGGGTEIFPALKQAYDELEGLDVQRKHIILLTDGYSATSNSYEALLEAGVDDKVTLSTVAIGSDADRVLLEELSVLGQGRFYDVPDASMIPSILSRETSMMTRTYIVDEPFTPIVYDDATYRDLFADGVPKMNAYIGTTAKPLAQVVAESEREDPIFAYWQYGLGTTMAFTSDAAGAWAGDWARWRQWKPFWQRAVSELLPAYHDVSYAIQSEGGGRFTITDATNEAAFLTIAAVNEDGEELPIETDVLTASKVQANVTAEPGLIFFSMTNKVGQHTKLAVQMPYSEEYKQLPTNEALLQTIAKQTGGKVITDPEDVFRDFQQKSVETRSAAYLFVLIALLLFFADITIRRFGIRWPLIQMRKRQNVPQEPIETAVSDLVREMKKK